MIQLSLPWIKTYAGSDSRFRAGFMLHRNQKILSVEAGARNSLNLTVDDGGTLQTTSLTFYQDTGTFRYAKCTCHQSQPCLHVIGGLLYVLYRQESLAETLSQDKTNRMYSAFEELLIQSKSTSATSPISLEVILSPRDVHSKIQNTTIQLKVTLHSTFIVKNIEQFVTAVVEDKPYEISRNLTYIPGKFHFDATDNQVICLLYDYYQTRKHITAAHSVPVMTPLKPSVQVLPGTYVKRLLDLLKDHRYSMDFDGLFFKNQSIEDRVEVDFYLHADEGSGSYQLSVNTYDVFFPLTEEDGYVFYNSQICHIGPKEKEAFKLFCHYLSDKVMEIPPAQLEDFITKVCPVLELIGYVHMDRSLQDRMVVHPLESSLYIDKNGHQLSLSLTYNYGPYVFQRFPETENPSQDDHLVVRNLELEHRIEGLLTAPAHKLDEQGRLTYTTEDDLYYFVDQQLRALQSLCNVYYSDDFRDTYLKSQKQLAPSLRYNSSENLLELNFEMEGISTEEIYELLRAVQEKKHYYKLKDGSFFTITEQLSRQVDALNHRFGLNLDEDGKPLVKASVANAFYLDQLMQTSRPIYSDSYKKLMSSINNRDKTTYPIPDFLKGTLRDYQKTGYRWLCSLSEFHLGGVLADDMGLGKTLQAIALMTASKPESPSIVVAPTSLIYNWEEEIHKFAPEAKTRVIVGTKPARHKLIAAIEIDEIVITSYGSLKRDLAMYEQQFLYCIIDEAQHIKNPRSLNARAVKALPAQYHFALTGTPIENTLSELWSIFDFILPGYLGSHDQFVKKYETPIVKNNDTEMLARLNQLAQPFILRRLKEDVLSELPPKIETKVSVELSSHQKKLYTAFVHQAQQDMTAYKDMPEGQRNMKVLSVLTRLRQLCCHPSLFDRGYKHGSSKLDLLLELVLDSIEGGHRVLVFSQFTSMLGLIQTLFDKHHIDYFYLDGAVPPIKRQQMVHDFNTGINDVFLISLKAGGTGLNLTGADVVIHYDPWWNPAAENQATDRAYRIGQRNRVQVYKLITSGTIEEKIYQMQKRKLNLIDSVIKPGETFLSKLSADELQSLFLEG